MKGISMDELFVSVIATCVIVVFLPCFIDAIAMALLSL
jgi:hypothetical protein